MPAKDTYTFDDLKSWKQITKDLTPPARLSVFGDPVAHSLSPEMHNPALEAAGIDSQYVRLHILPDQLGDALAELKQQDFIGTNVTIPHKAEVLKHMTEVTEVARRIGTVNTVLVDGDDLLGHNSDAPGFERAIREEFSVDLRDLRIMILGAGGGAGRAAAVQCALDHCERLVLVNRTIEKAEALKSELESVYRDDVRLLGPVDRLEVIPWNEDALRHQMNYVDLIVNGTSLGMKRTDPALIQPSLFQPHQMVFDMVYAPARTRLMADAEATGAQAANGLSMLLWQGAISFDFWFNREAPIEAMRKGLKEAVAGR